MDVESTQSPGGNTLDVLCASAEEVAGGINSRLALVMKSGKFTLGTKTCLKCLRSGKGALHLQPGRSGQFATLSSRRCSGALKEC